MKTFEKHGFVIALEVDGNEPAYIPCDTYKEFQEAFQRIKDIGGKDLTIKTYRSHTTTRLDEIEVPEEEKK